MMGNCLTLHGFFFFPNIYTNAQKQEEGFVEKLKFLLDVKEWKGSHSNDTCIYRVGETSYSSVHHGLKRQKMG